MDFWVSLSELIRKLKWGGQQGNAAENGVGQQNPLERPVSLPRRVICLHYKAFVVPEDVKSSQCNCSENNAFRVNFHSRDSFGQPFKKPDLLDNAKF